MRSATATGPVSTAGGQRRVEMHERGKHRHREQSREPGRGIVHARRDAELRVPDRASTVAVSGATVHARPRPNTITAGSTVAT